MTVTSLPVPPDRVVRSLDRARWRNRREALRAHPSRRRDYDEDDAALAALLPALEDYAVQWGQGETRDQRPEWQRLAVYFAACAAVALVAVLVTRHMAFFVQETLPAIARGLGG